MSKLHKYTEQHSNSTRLCCQVLKYKQKIQSINQPNSVRVYANLNIVILNIHKNMCVNNDITDLQGDTFQYHFNYFLYNYTLMDTI